MKASTPRLSVTLVVEQSQGWGLSSNGIKTYAKRRAARLLLPFSVRHPGVQRFLRVLPVIYQELPSSGYRILSTTNYTNSPQLTEDEAVAERYSLRNPDLPPGTITIVMLGFPVSQPFGTAGA